MAELPGPWPARIAWGALPLTVAPALGDALGAHSVAVARTASTLAWVAWALGLLAVAVPRTVSLTALRVLAPLVIAASLWAALSGDPGVAAIVAVTWAIASGFTVVWPEVAEAFVDGSSYGDERRMLLRTPTPLLLGPVQLTWTAAVAGPVAGPLLLASRQWVLGGLVCAVGAAASAGAVRALHGLARRWVVFVPAGIVLHDLQAMADPVLFPRAAVAALGPATRIAPVDGGGDEGGDGEVCDLTLGTVGLALQLDLREPQELAPRRGRVAGSLVAVRHVRFAAARPGALLAEARRRRIG